MVGLYQLVQPQRVSESSEMLLQQTTQFDSENSDKAGTLSLSHATVHTHTKRNSLSDGQCAGVLLQSIILQVSVSVLCWFHSIVV